ACFGAAFLVWRPTRYAQLLAAKMQSHQAHAWLVNTGWTGGAFGVGERIKLSHTRAIIDAIHSGALASAPVTPDPLFRLSAVTACPGCPQDLLVPRNAWSDLGAYDAAAARLAGWFEENHTRYSA